MNFKKRCLIFVTFFGSCLAIALLAASLGTKYWVQATCYRNSTQESRIKSNGTVHFGLFEGTKVLNVGLGDRETEFLMLDVLYAERDLVMYELYMATVATVCGGILFGIIAAMMAIINTASNPTEQICHIPGLYTFNGIALFSTLAAIVTWMVQFYLVLTHNVLTYQDRQQKWVSSGLAIFGSSFWMVVIAGVVFVINIIIISIANNDPTKFRHAKQMHTIPGKQHGDTMLY